MKSIEKTINKKLKKHNLTCKIGTLNNLLVKQKTKTLLYILLLEKISEQKISPHKKNYTKIKIKNPNLRIGIFTTTNSLPKGFIKYGEGIDFFQTINNQKLVDTIYEKIIEEISNIQN